MIISQNAESISETNMELTRLLNSIIFLSMVGKGVGARKEKEESETFESEIFQDGLTEEENTWEERKRAERSLIGGESFDQQLISIKFPPLQNYSK